VEGRMYTNYYCWKEERERKRERRKRINWLMEVKEGEAEDDENREDVQEFWSSSSVPSVPISQAGM
jgi:hypothetical protein